MSTKTDLIKFRVATEEKAHWERIARAQGMTVSSWLRQIAEEEAAKYEAVEGDAEQKRAERRLLMKTVSPHDHSFQKKSYEPDYK